jgi:hypothetical protein
MEEGKMGNVATVRAVLAILQWWGFNVTVIIMNKWIFQVLPTLLHLTFVSIFPHLLGVHELIRVISSRLPVDLSC